MMLRAQADRLKGVRLRGWQCLLCKNLFRIVLLAMVAGLLAAPSLLAAQAPVVEKNYAIAVAYYHNLKTNGDWAASREKWRYGIRSFQLIYRQYPNHPLAPACIFATARMYHDLYQGFGNPPDLEEALAYYGDLLALFPEHRLADDALYAMGRIQQVDKGDDKQAIEIFKRLRSAYPGGDMAGRAAARISGQAGKGGEERKQRGQEARNLSARRGSTEEAAVVEIQAVNQWSTAVNTRVVIQASAPVEFSRQVLPEDKEQPSQLYLDLHASRLASGLKTVLPSREGGLLRQIRLGQYTSDTVRLVLDFHSLASHKISTLQDPFRIIIDIRGRQEERKTTPADSRPEGGAPTLAQQLGLKIRKIVLDPGHGGKDPGAIGPGGLLEKDITLRIARSVAAQLRKKSGYEVILTREKDVFLPLEKRTAIANRAAGDLFISLHVNAAPNTGASGIETYFLNLATSGEEMQAAARENASSSGQLSDLQAILMDIIQNSKIDESAKLAELIQDQLVAGLRQKYGDIQDLGVKKAPFIVLIGAQMPAILIEAGFLSNEAEAKRLRHTGYQEALADQVSAGIILYAAGLKTASLLGPGNRAPATKKRALLSER